MEKLFEEYAALNMELLKLTVQVESLAAELKVAKETPAQIE